MDVVTKSGMMRGFRGMFRRLARHRIALGGLLAVIAAAAIALAAAPSHIAAYFTDNVGGGQSATSGHLGLKVESGLSGVTWPSDLTQQVLNQVSSAITGELPSTVTGTAATTAVSSILSTLTPQITSDLDNLFPYTYTVTVTNTGTVPWRGDATMFDYFANDTASDTPETGAVGIYGSSTSLLGIATAAVAQDVGQISLGSVSVPLVGNISLGSVNLSSLLGAPPGTLVGPTTADDSTMPNGASEQGQVAGADQDPALGGITLQPGQSTTLTYTVLVNGGVINTANCAVADIITTNGVQHCVMNLTVGTHVSATSLEDGTETGWTAAASDWDGTLSKVQIDQPPVITASTSPDLTPFTGQIGASGQPGLAQYEASLFTAQDDKDGDISPQVQVSTDPDLDPNTPGTYTATGNVTDSQGLAATPVSEDIHVWNLTGVECGQYHCLATDSRGRVWGWGLNNYGQADGSGGTSNVMVPHLIQGLPHGLKVKQVAGTFATSYFLMSDGSVYALGYGPDGELGNGGNSNSATPVKVSLPEPVTQISGLRYSAAALGQGGAVYTWGYGDYGALGTGNSNSQNTPQQIISSGATGISQGAYGGAAVMSDGTIRQWGTNIEGEMGTGTADGTYNHTPTTVPGTSNAQTVSVGYQHTLYLTADGQVWGYGGNANNRFLPGGNTGALPPTRITGPWTAPVRQVHAGWDYSQVVTADGGMWSIGYNSYDSLWIGSQNSQTQWTQSIVSGISQVAGFYDNDAALRSDGGMIYTKGYGGSGTLGNNSTADLVGTANGQISLTNLYNDGNTYPDSNGL